MRQVQHFTWLGMKPRRDTPSEIENLNNKKLSTAYATVSI